MTTPLELLTTLQARGCRLFPQGEQLGAEVPPGALTDEFREQIRTHKPALLAILQPKPPRHAGGLRVTRPESPCSVCGGVEWQYHVTYRYCLSCGQEAGPGYATPIARSMRHLHQVTLSDPAL